MGNTAFVLARDSEEGEFGTARASLLGLPSLWEQHPGDRDPGALMNVDPPVLTPGRVTLDLWLAAKRWLDFSRGADLPPDWMTKAPLRENPTVKCTERGGTGKQRLAVQVPCDGSKRACDHREWGSSCNGLVTVAWATIEFGPLQVVDYRYRLRRSKSNQFKLSDGSYQDATPDIEPICLPGRWARGGPIEATS